MTVQFTIESQRRRVANLERSATSQLMQLSSSLVLLAALLVGGCATTSPAPAPKHSGIVGTWRWVRAGQTPVKEPLYIRYYADGTAATWPAPEDWPTTVAGVSHGRYHLEGQCLVIETGAGKDDPKPRMEVKGDEMILISNESDRLIYRRIVPDLEPGKFPEGVSR